MKKEKKEIKMRVNQDKDAVCKICLAKSNEVLNMFDLKLGDVRITICDECNEELLRKTLNAECFKNGRVKSREDIAMINKRNQRRKF